MSRAAFASVLMGPRALGASLVAARCASSSPVAAAAAAAATAYGEQCQNYTIGVYINPVPLLCQWQLRFLRFPKLIPDHASFVKEIAATDPPEHLNSLLNVLQARGMTSNISQGFLLWLLPCCPPPLVRT